MGLPSNVPLRKPATYQDLVALPEHLVVPDVPFFELAPDWICEVLSPSTAKLDLVRKLPRYARAGVEHAWVVNPIHQTLEVFHQEKGRWFLMDAFAGDDRVRAPPFDAIELELGSLWLEEPST
jgi:Uma2 family endonuclease